MRLRGHPARLAAASALAIASGAKAGETIHYSYDELGRLTRVVHSGSVNDGVAADYGYDPGDNRSQVGVTVPGAAPPPPPPAPGNRAPAAASDSFQVQRCAAATLDPLANDSDPDGDPLTLASVSGAAAQVGQMGISNNRLSWSAAASSGTYAGAYTIADGRGGSATGTFTVQLGPGGC